MLLKCLTKRRQANLDRIDQERTTCLQTLDANISAYEAARHMVGQVQVPDQSQWNNDEAISAYFEALYGPGNAEQPLNMYRATRESDPNPELLITILEDTQQVLLYGIESDLELARRTQERVRTSKTPGKDYQAFLTYLQAERDFALKSSEAGGCGFAVGEPPRKPKFLR